MKRKTTASDTRKAGRMKRRLSALLCFCLLVLCAAGCTGERKETGTQESGGTGGASSGAETAGENGGEYVYVPEFIRFAKEGYLSSPFQAKGKLYYSVYVYDEETMRSDERYYALDPVTMEQEEIVFPYGGENSFVYMECFYPDGAGNYYVLLQDGSKFADMTAQTIDAASARPDSLLVKQDGGGEELFRQDITEELDGAYPEMMFLDGENRLYLAVSDGRILLFEADGAYHSAIETDGYVSAIGEGRDGRVYCLCREGAESRLYGLDYEKAETAGSYGGFPDSYNEFLMPGTESDFLVYDDNAVYGYDLSSQSYTTLFDWLDSDIYGSGVLSLSALADGRLFASARDDDNTLILLTKTPESEIPEKETVTVGSFYGGSELQRLAVGFNRSSDRYRVALKIWYDRNSGVSYDDLRASVNAELLAGRGPDIYDLSFVEAPGRLAAKGLFEDLTPYLEADGGLDRKDYLETVLDAYTYGDVLAAIPPYFTLHTLAGSGETVGKEPGWTFGDILALAAKHPQESLFYYASREEMLEYCLALNEKAFVDWEAGSCRFDSEEFRELLEFLSLLPEEEAGAGEVSEGTMLSSGQVLLKEADFYSFQSLTELSQYFGGADTTCIGYPAADGSRGCLLEPEGGAYAISAMSGHKEGAWAFVSYAIKSGAEEIATGSFSSNKALLERQIAEATADPYELDENGETALDENGEPVRRYGGYSTYGDGFRVYSYVPLAEDIDLLRELIDAADTAFIRNDPQLCSIIMEEADGFFHGQKSAEDAAKIIQSRALLYINEG